MRTRAAITITTRAACWAIACDRSVACRSGSFRCTTARATAPSSRSSFRREMVVRKKKSCCSPPQTKLERKRRMLLAYTDVERFRPQAAYDSSRPPQRGTLNYEAWGWPMRGAKVSVAFAAFSGKRGFRMSLRILYVAYPLLPVTEESCGGAEQVLRTLEAKMARRGHHTVVAAAWGSRATVCDACCVACSRRWPSENSCPRVRNVMPPFYAQSTVFVCISRDGRLPSWRRDPAALPTIVQPQ